MKKISAKTLKGFRDFLPDEAGLREQLIEKIKEGFRLFGFEPLETPALEYADVLLGKYGEEADKLIYLFKDRGGRLIGLRYDQTVPLARVIANYQNIIKPLKRYQIQPVWRAENPQRGRFREFIQCDIDIIGEKSYLADGETITCAIKTAQNLGFKKIKMLINDRQLFAGLDQKIILTIDKLEKIGEKKVIEEIQALGFSQKESKNLLQEIKNEKPTENLKKIFSFLELSGFKKDIDFSFKPTLARGLEYYTSTIFELIDEDYKSGSLGGGGRYDKLISQFTNQELPAVGFSFGFDRLVDAFKKQKSFNVQREKRVFIAYFNDTLSEVLKLAEKLREKNISCEINLNPEKKLDKQLKYADKKEVNYVLILGEEEIKKQKIKLKIMKTGEQKEIDLNKIIDILKKLLV